MAVIIAVTASWELTLLLAFCFPIYASVGYFQLRIIRGRTEKNKALVEQSGSTAVESIDNIRTVASLAVEPRFYRQYYEQLKYPLRQVNKYEYFLIHTCTYRYQCLQCSAFENCPDILKVDRRICHTHIHTHTHIIHTLTHTHTHTHTHTQVQR